MLTDTQQMRAIMNIIYKAEIGQREMFWNGVQQNSPNLQLTEKPKKPQQFEHVKCDWYPTITDGIVSKNTTDTECSQMMVSIVKGIGLQRGVLFLGDSTMYKFWKEARQLQRRNPDSVKIIRASRCNWLQSFGIKPSIVWQKPNRTREGPVLFGLGHNWCTDCSGCNSHVLIPKRKADSFFLMDYIAVEFARDVEMQSVLGNTTQETLSKYLQQQGKLYSLCVMNSGFHDQKIKELNADGYVSNVKEYLELLIPVCLHIIWIETTAPSGNKNYAQTVKKTGKWNKALNSYLETHLNRNVSVVRVFEKSLKAKHKDNVHMHQLWYFELARTLFEKIVDIV